jgi:hypothetical protein
MDSGTLNQEGRMEDTLVKIEKGLTREALIDKLIDERLGNWDTWEALYHGRNGYSELSNAVLEEMADEWFSYEPLAYRITEGTHEISEGERLREINRELVEVLKQSQRVLQTWEFPWVKEAFYKNAAAIAKAEGRA